MEYNYLFILNTFNVTNFVRCSHNIRKFIECIKSTNKRIKELCNYMYNYNIIIIILIHLAY